VTKRNETKRKKQILGAPSCSFVSQSLRETASDLSTAHRRAALCSSSLVLLWWVRRCSSVDRAGWLAGCWRSAVDSCFVDGWFCAFVWILVFGSIYAIIRLSAAEERREKDRFVDSGFGGFISACVAFIVLDQIHRRHQFCWTTSKKQRDLRAPRLRINYGTFVVVWCLFSRPRCYLRVVLLFHLWNSGGAKLWGCLRTVFGAKSLFVNTFLMVWLFVC